MEIQVRVEQLAVGASESGILKEPTLSLEFTLEGIVGDRHAGFTKKADGRDQGVRRGTIVRNWRQWSAVSTEELERISAAMQIEKIEPTWLGANIAFSGHESLTQIPKGSTIWFSSGAVLTVEGENAPCIGPGKEIARHFDSVSPSAFPKAAQHLRGLVGVVYRAGKVSLGSTATIVPYEGFDALTRPPQDL
ncbi:MAG: hypothetical protein K2W95_14955 [Candidatus Obscuribacterales bacterium]|nr:hypothetical protein [Candidatus Obscuribacterales bacterium]